MQFSENQLETIYQFLQTGNLLAYPTEAVWGIGCNPFNEQAVKQILAIKKRPYEKGMIVVTADTALIQPFLQSLSPTTLTTITQSWQAEDKQATTWLLPIPNNLSQKIPEWVTGGRDTLAIRVIRHPIIADLCRTIAKKDKNNPFGFLVSTSCNPTSEIPATTFDQAQAYFGDNIGYLNAPTLGYTQPSQIKDALTGELIRI